MLRGQKQKKKIGWKLEYIQPSSTLWISPPPLLKKISVQMKTQEWALMLKQAW